MRPLLTLVVLSSALLVANPAARAADREVEITLDQRFLYDSNPQLLVSDVKSLNQSSTTPQIAFKSKTPTSFLNLAAAVTQNFANLDGYDTTDGKASAKIGRSMQDWQAALGVTGAYDTTHTSELTTLGRIADNDRRSNVSVAPEIAYLPSALDRIDVSGSYAQTVYDSALYTDYHLSSASLGYTRALSERHSAFLSTTAQRYQAQENARNRTDTIAPSTGWLTNWTDVFKTRLSIGAEASQQTIGQTRLDWEWGQIYSASILYDGEQDKTELTLSRQTEPLVNGTTTLLTGLQLSETYKTNAKLSLSFNGAVYHGSANEAASGDLKTRYEANPGLGYQIERGLDLRAGYNFRQEDLYGRDKTGYSHSVRLGLTFKP